MYEAQKDSRKRAIKEGWLRVEAFLDPETADRWRLLRPHYDGPTALVRDALNALPEPKRKRRRVGNPA